MTLPADVSGTLVWALLREILRASTDEELDRAVARARRVIGDTTGEP